MNTPKQTDQQTKAPAVNKKYKDSLFFFVFGREENKPYLLELYNALRAPEAPPITDIDELELNTIENVIYLGRKNDVSFLIDSEMNLYEHQSTYNPNMPLRGAIYWALLMQKWLETQRKEPALYCRSLIRIPTPRHIVFYNGFEKRPTMEELRLSNAFIKPVKGCEWTTVVYNINPGNNEPLLARCQPLKEYAEFTGNVRNNLNKGMTLENAIEAAYPLAAKGKCLGSFFKQHRMEVTDMFLTEFNEKEYIDYVREERRTEGALLTYIKLVRGGLLDSSIAAEQAGMSLEEFKKLMLENE